MFEGGIGEEGDAASYTHLCGPNSTALSYLDAYLCQTASEDEV